MLHSAKVRSLVGIGAAVLLLGSAFPVRADLLDVNIFDNTIYEQSTASAPTTPSFFFFNAGGDFHLATDFTAASVTIPTSPSTTTQSLTINGTSFGFGSSLFTNLPALHTTYPFGSYTITASGGTVGSETVPLSYTADAFTSDIPALDPGTFTGLQGLNPAHAFTIDFNPFTPNLSTTPLVNEEFTFFTIRNSVGAVVFFDPFLPDTTTSILLPANTLLPGTNYTFELDFSDRIAGSSAGVATFEGFENRTDGSFTTGSATVPEPTSLALFGTAAGVLALLRRRTLAKRS